MEGEEKQKKEKQIDDDKGWKGTGGKKLIRDEKRPVRRNETITLETKTELKRLTRGRVWRTRVHFNKI